MTRKTKKAKKNSAWDVISSIITTLLLLTSIIIMAVTLISTRVLNNDAETYLFGYKPYIVNSNSMEGEFDAGDVIVVKKVDTNDLEVGDVISFHSIDPTNYYETLTHRIINETTYDGALAFNTQGDANGFADAYPAVSNNITGKYIFKIAKAGYFFDFLKTPAGYVSCILLPFVILFIVQAVNIVKLSKENKKQMEKERQKEKEKLEETHRNEMDEMRKEIEALKNQLNNKQ